MLIYTSVVWLASSATVALNYHLALINCHLACFGLMWQFWKLTARSIHNMYGTAQVKLYTCMSLHMCACTFTIYET